MEDPVRAARASILYVFMKTDRNWAKRHPDAACMKSFLESPTALEVAWVVNISSISNPGQARAQAQPLHERQKADNNG